MKKIIEYKYGVTDYNVGDVVYLSRKRGKVACKAIALSDINGRWKFKPLQKTVGYLIRDGIISFGGKPWIFAKEIEIKEEQL